MSYTLFVGDNCHQCEEVVEHLNAKKVEYRKVNVDHEEERPPFPVFVYPAMFNDDRLIAYGGDIKRHFQ